MTDKTSSSFPQIEVTTHQNPMRAEQKVSYTFVSQEHLEYWLNFIKQQGYEQGKKEALRELQSKARTLLNDFLGKTIL